MHPQSSTKRGLDLIFIYLIISFLFFSCTNKKEMNNPLLVEFNTPYNTPPFHLINNNDYLPAFQEAIEIAKSEIESIINNKKDATFENTIVALEKSGKLLSTISSLFFNINSAETSDSIQEIARKVSPLLSAFSNDIVLNEKLFKRIKTVYDNKRQLRITPEQQMLLENTYKNFTRQGALLNEAEKKEYRKISAELSDLSLAFGENTLAETNAFQLLIVNEKELAGIPEQFLEAAQLLAKEQKKDGWIFTLHAPSYIPFMQYADNRTLREEMYKAFSARGNNDNKNDNKNIIKRTTELRLKKAKLLGYSNYADYVLENRMAESTENVLNFLDDLFEKSFSFAQNDVKEIEEYAHSLDLKDNLQRWDYSYYAEKLKKAKFNLSDEMTRPYFQLEKVKDGIFDLSNKLFDITFTRNYEIPTYHSDVEVYEVFEGDGTLLSILYLDFFPRSSKQGGAWMTSFREQYKDENDNVRPLISLVCNFTPPSANRPSLLTFNEVTTFLHEFGHALHGMFSDVTYESLAGTSVFRDFVELPSQLMENWATEKEWLNSVARHYETNQVIPSELVDKIIASSKFQSGYFTVRQLSFGFTDMAWHTLTDAYDGDVITFEKEAMAKTELFPDVENVAMSTAFAHIFNGGYAAGYYGYKWAEVLDADAFSLFKERGIYDKTTAANFRHNILSKGGTEHPMKLYIAYKGSEPTNDALLERSGLVEK